MKRIGEYVLEPDGDVVRLGRDEGGEVCWLDPIPVSALPENWQEADDERLLAAVRGVETAQNTRGG